MKKIILILGLSISAAFSHTAVMSCFDNGDNTITCEAGFSDGSSASGVKFEVHQDGKIIETKKFNDLGEAVFDKPKGDYEAVMNAGEGHQVTVKSSDIF
jgi:hypothetical protein